MEGSASPSRPLTRTASLEGPFLKSLPEETEAPEDEDDDPADLRRIEEFCMRTMRRCTEHEHQISKLGHEIESRITRWDSLVTSLKTLDDRAHKLTERIHTSLHSLRTDTTDQLQSAKEAVRRADDRVGYSTRTLRQANDTIRESAKAIEVLEKRLFQEDAMLEQVTMVTTMALWLSVTSAVLLSLLVAWLTLRS